jgi:diacylglycerol kinase (ATP)
MIGQLAYYMKGLEKLPRLRPIQLTIKSEEMSFTEDCMIFLVANSHSVAGFEKLAPYASLQDGCMDVLVLKKVNLAEFVRLVTLVTRGEHIHDPNVIHFQTKYLEVTSPDHTQLNVDGEFGGTLPAVISVLPSHLDIIVDETKIAGYNKAKKRSEQQDGQ